jgi:hypothetical protein
LSEIIWAVLALLFFLFFSTTPEGQQRPFWYSAGTTIFEQVAYFTAFLLCARNWLSRQIVSGRSVWLCIGLGMLSYFIGNFFFFTWEDIFGLEPEVSPGDIFYVLTYVLLITGMLLAVTSRRLNLEIWQWGIVAAIAALGIILSWLISNRSPTTTYSPHDFFIQPAVAQTAPASLTQKPAQVPPAPVTAPVTEVSKAPEWAVNITNQMSTFKDVFTGFYVVSDILLLILAATLLLAFWGGRFAQSWRMIAAAALCLFIADIWFRYAIENIANYQSGSLPEVFWVFNGVLFGIGAALEYDVSSRSRRSSGRRRAA